MSYEKELRTVLDVVQEAGELLRREFHRWGGPRGHSGHAEVDEEAEWLIRKRLLSEFRNYRYRGEETGSVASQDPHVWLIDPNDGTSAYLRGARGSAVSVGLVRAGIPVLGVVYAFVAPDDGGDLIYWAEGIELARNGEPIKPNWNAPRKSQTVLLVSMHRENMIPELLECIHPYRYIASPSIAYRLALAAAGDSAAAISWHNPGDWDFAGGHALVRGAGGVFWDDKGQEISYSPDGESKAQRCFGGDIRVVRDLLKLNWERLQTAHTRNTIIKPRTLYMFSRPKAGKALWNSGLLSRAQGCLFGQCTGDALGQQVEFLDPQTIRSKFPEGLRTMNDGGTWSTLAGQITDDSEMALLLARTIIQEERYDAGQVAQAYQYWFDETSPFDIGNTIGAALRNTPNPDSQANGSLMRISPLGIYGYRMSIERLWGFACIESALTHPNPVCQHACALFVCAIANAIESGRTPQEIYAFALNLATQQNVEAVLLNALQNAQTNVPEVTSQQGWVINAFQNAFYQLLHCSSAEEAIINTTALGGDTDTNAAIAGALSGSVFGRDSIPFFWRQMVLSCRPHPSIGAEHPRPLCLWPSDIPMLSERLLLCG